MAKKFPVAVRFYMKGQYTNGKLDYKGNSIAECVLKAVTYRALAEITSFTVLERAPKGSGKRYIFGQNFKFGEYMNSLFPETQYKKFH